MCIAELKPELLPKYRKQRRIGYKIVDKIDNQYKTPFYCYRLNKDVFNVATAHPENTLLKSDELYTTGFHIYPNLTMGRIALKYLTKECDCHDYWAARILVKVEYEKIIAVGTDGTSGRHGKMLKLINLVVEKIKLVSEVE